MKVYSSPRQLTLRRIFRHVKVEICLYPVHGLCSSLVTFIVCFAWTRNFSFTMSLFTVTFVDSNKPKNYYKNQRNFINITTTVTANMRE